MTNESLRTEQLQLQVDALQWVLDHVDGTPDQFLDYYAERILCLTGCDQVIFRDTHDKRTVRSLPGLSTQQQEACVGCPFAPVTSDLYEDGCISMDDCRAGCRGVMTNEGCLVKSALMQQVYIKKTLVGALTLHYFQNKHTFDDDERATLRMLAGILGLCLDRMKAHERRQRRSVDYVAASGLNALYELDPYSGAYRAYLNRPATQFERTSDTALSGKDLYANVQQNVLAALVEEDRDKCAAFYSREHMIKLYESGSTDAVELCWAMQGKRMWIRSRVMPDPKLGLSLIAMEDITADVKARREKDERYQETIRAFASEYVSAMLVNLSTGAMTGSGFNPEREELLQQIMGEENTFENAFMDGIRQYVHPDDRGDLMESLTLKRIRDKLTKQRSFVITFRSIYGGVTHYQEFKFIAADVVNGVPMTAVVAFSDVSDEAQRHFVNELLYSEYSAIYLVDLDKDELTPIRRSSHFSNGRAMKSVPYRQTILAAAEDTGGNGAAFMRSAAEADYVRLCLKDMNRREFTYSMRVGSKTIWHRCTMHAMEREKGVVSRVLLTFGDVDDIQNQNHNLYERLNETNRIITALSEDLESICYVSINTDKFSDTAVVLRESDSLAHNVPGWADEKLFTNRLTLLEKHVVHPDDRDTFHLLTRRERLIERLKQDKLTVVAFRGLIGDTVMQYEIRFVAVNDNDGTLTHMLAAIRNVDEQKQRAQRDARLLEQQKEAALGK